MYVLAVMNNFFDTLFSYQNGNLFLNFIFLYNMFGYLISFSVEIIPYPVCKNRLKSFRPNRELFVKETHIRFLEEGEKMYTQIDGGPCSLSADA